jgi:hypothetical protein
MRVNKKGQTGHTMVKSIVWFIFLIIVLFSIVYMVRSNITQTIDIRNVEAEVFYHGSLSALSLNDDIIDRTYMGVIDLNNFNQDYLEKKLNYGPHNTYMTANFTLFDKDVKMIKTFIYNKDAFNKYEPLTRSYIPGTGSATKVEKEVKVMINDNGKVYSGLLNITIIYPNK